MHTIWLQIFVKQYFHEFHNDHENFCHELFLKTAYGTGLNCSKSQKFKKS